MDYPPISDLNSFQAIIFWFFGVIGVSIYKVLAYIMPKTASILKEYYIKEFTKDIKNELEELNARLDNYRNKKHKSEGELANLKQIIIDNDQEIIDSVRELLTQRKKWKQATLNLY